MPRIYKFHVRFVLHIHMWVQHRGQSTNTVIVQEED
jgi:hypothetical protein